MESEAIVKQRDISSKVLVFDSDPQVLGELAKFFEKEKISIVRSVANPSVLEVILQKNPQLGGMFLSGVNNEVHQEIGKRMKALRPELPVFIRIEDEAEMERLPEEKRRLFDGFFHIKDKEKLSLLLRDFIFIREYPSELVHHIYEFSMKSFKFLLPNASIHSHAPLIVRGQAVYGDLISFIPLNTAWCRGYMVLEANPKRFVPLIRSLSNQREDPEGDQASAVLGELTNIMWGGFKAAFPKGNAASSDGMEFQVPIVADHGRGSLSFGGSAPFLSFAYHLEDPLNHAIQAKVVQNFIFNLKWEPSQLEASPSEEGGKEDQPGDSFLEQGSIELF